MSNPRTPPSIQITRAGWLALVLSIAAGVGLRFALQVWNPEQYVQTTRNDPRQGGLGAMMMIPIFALWVWIIFTLLGYPLFRVSPPPTDSAPESDRESNTE